jgi:hypothetical protein
VNLEESPVTPVNYLGDAIDTVPGGRANSLIDLPLPTTPTHANNALLADTVDIVPGTHDLTDEDLPFPSTPVAKVARYPEGTPVSATNNLPLLSTPRTTNDSHHAPINLDDPKLLSASLSDSLLFPASASFNLDSLLSKQNLGDPRIDEILSNQRKIVSSLNSLHGLVKHIIQQQPHTGGFSVSEDVIHVVDLPVMHINNPITETVASTVAQPSTVAQSSPAGTVTDQPFSNEEL